MEKDSAENTNITSIIKNIRSCNLDCYKDRYIRNLKTRSRVITKEELLSAKPLIDDWRNQKILFISQSPSKQAFADGVLNSKENEFLINSLLRKLFKEQEDGFKIWKSCVFWVHYSNCYPFAERTKTNMLQDCRPYSKCANKYLEMIIESMNPKIIVLMGWFSTHFFASSIRNEIKSSSTYPSLSEILKYQMDKKSFFTLMPPKTNKQYKGVIIPHTANRQKKSPHDRYSFDFASESILSIYNNQS